MDYKKILEGVVGIINTTEKSDIGFANICSYIGENCPELAESEDERMRKAILTGLIDCRDAPDLGWSNFGGINIDECIAWLEKQSSEPNWYHHKVDLSDCSEEYRKAYYDGWNNCNMQYSQCRSELNDVIKCLINGMKFYYEDNEEATWGTDKWSMPVKHIIEVLEKQGEQKSVNKVEPKFKVGDFIVNDYCMGKVIALTDDAYLLDTEQGIPFSREHNAHLWAINDAKDGDVLYSPTHHLIWLYKDNEHYHAAINLNYADVVSFDNEIAVPSDVCPANRVQKSILFQKMEEAGYEWRQEEKKLIKRNEPKFKVGDWIINRTDATIMQIVNNEDFYESVEIGGQRRTDTYNYVEWDFRLWTIQDAKDGDILAGIKGDVILMFRGIGNTEWDDVIDYHCYYECYLKDFIVQEDGEYWGNTKNSQLKPATKEQRDLLFEKMKEAGYKWDSEKKELKNVNYKK